MNVFILNCGSSSVKGQRVDLKLRAVVLGGRVEWIGEENTALMTWRQMPSGVCDESAASVSVADRRGALASQSAALGGRGERAAYAKQSIHDKLIEHRHHIREHGEDMPEVHDWDWRDERTGPRE